MVTMVTVKALFILFVKNRREVKGRETEESRQNRMGKDFTVTIVTTVT